MHNRTLFLSWLYWRMQGYPFCVRVAQVPLTAITLDCQPHSIFFGGLPSITASLWVRSQRGFMMPDRLGRKWFVLSQQSASLTQDLALETLISRYRWNGTSLALNTSFWLLSLMPFCWHLFINLSKLMSWSASFVPWIRPSSAMHLTLGTRLPPNGHPGCLSYELGD